MTSVFVAVEDFYPTLHPDLIVQCLPLPWHGLFGSLSVSVHLARDWLDRQRHDVKDRRLDASRTPPDWHALLESLTVEVAFVLCDKVGWLPRLLLLPRKLQKAFLSFLLLEHSRIPCEAAHHFVNMLLPFTKSSDWILTDLLLLDNKLLHSCDHASHSNMSLLPLTIKQRCEKISEKLKHRKMRTKWIPMWISSTESELNNGEDRDANSAASGSDSSPVIHNPNKDKPHPFHVMDVRLQNAYVNEIGDVESDNENDQEPKRRKFSKETECVVPCSPQNSEACIIPPEAIVPCDVGLSERSVFSQPTPTKLGLDRLQELQDKLSTFISDSDLSPDMKSSVLKLRDEVLSVAIIHSEMDDELQSVLMKCSDQQVNEVCLKLKCDTMMESQLIYLANRMCDMKDEPSYHTCCQFMQNAFLAWLSNLQQSVSRLVTSTVQRLAQRFGRAFILGIAVPMLTKDCMGKVQVELLSRILRDALSVDDHQMLLREYLRAYLTGDAIWSDNVVAVLHIVINAKVALVSDTLDMLVEAMERNALPCSSSLLFTKLVHSVVQQFQLQIRCHGDRLKGIFDCNRTFLRKAGLAALAKI